VVASRLDSRFPGASSRAASASSPVLVCGVVVGGTSAPSASTRSRVSTACCAVR